MLHPSTFFSQTSTNTEQILERADFFRIFPKRLFTFFKQTLKHPENTFKQIRTSATLPTYTILEKIIGKDWKQLSTIPTQARLYHEFAVTAWWLQLLLVECTFLPPLAVKHAERRMLYSYASFTSFWILHFLELYVKTPASLTRALLRTSRKHLCNIF